MSLLPELSPAQTNGVLREVYANLAGSTLPDLTNAAVFPNTPDYEVLEFSFEAPSNFSDNYGQRMRALLTPPVTGNYTFWISSDDNSTLFLSTDEDPAHKTRVAWVSSWTDSRQWSKEANQKSAPINLAGGSRYYIEALQKEGAGGDNLAVTWQRPGDTLPTDGSAPINGMYLVPYGLGPPIIAAQPTNVTVIEGGTATFGVQVARKLGATFQWRRDSVDIPNETNLTCSVGPLALRDSGSTFSCRVVNSLGSTNSASALLTVTADVTKPTLNFVSNLGDVTLLTVAFSEALEPSSATDAANYTISGGVKVLSASFGPDTRTIILTTTPMAMDTGYTLTVNNVRDRAETPNTILPDSQAGFSLGTTPLDISYVLPNSEPVGPSSRRSPITVSEIMYHPPPRQDGRNLEYVEVYNSNPFIEDISGFRLTGEIEFTFPTNTVLTSRAYLVVAAVPADVKNVYGIVNVTGPYTNALSNGQGTLRLRNREGGVIFETSYSGAPPWPVSADGAGHSLVLARPSLGERNPAAWGASDLIGGNPGRVNSAVSHPYRTVLINEFLAHTDEPDFDYVELFNYSQVPVDLSGCALTDNPGTNKFVIPTNTIIQAQGFLVWDERQLGFQLSAAGDSIYLKDPAGTRVIDAVRFGPQENGVSMGRTPDGNASFSRLLTKTPGAPNSRARLSPVAINEVMYAPISGEDDDQYVELCNWGAEAADVGGWRLEDGIRYTIPGGTVIAPNGYLVIARSATRLLTNYPGLAGAGVLGDFSGALSRGGERIALSIPDELVTTNSSGARLTNFVHIVVDEVTYGTGGRWGQWAHGGGSSLELVNPRSDHRLASNWADSDETGKSQWVTVQRTGVLDNGVLTPDSLQIILFGAGECLIDNVEVFVPGGTNRISNPGFATGMSGWVAQGDHEDTGWEPTQGYGGGGCLHLRATDRGDTGANRIRTALGSPLAPGQTVTLRARVRWLAGNPEILLRLKGNWLEATTNICSARNLGTPGAPNSRARANVGPAITAVTHTPVVPGSYQQVTVVARVNDADGLAALLLKYRVDPSSDLKSVAMVNRGAGLFSALIPGQAAGRLVAFHIEALDNFSSRTQSQFPADPARECLVRWGDPGQGGFFGTYRLWMTQATFDRWSKREHLSNKALDCTFIYNNSRPIYNIGAQYSGSPWHAPGYDTPTGNVCDYFLDFPGDDSLLGEQELTLQWPGNGGGDNTYQREQTAYWMAEQLGLPWCNRRSINLFINGVRRAEMFEDVQQPNGDMMEEYYPGHDKGDLHKVQLWFEFDDAAVNFNAAGASLGNVVTTGGAKKLEFYRWTFAKRAVRDSASNYTNVFALVDAANFGGLGASYRRQLENTVDIDNWLKTYAVEHIVGNIDSFAYGGGQNMYACKPETETWKMMIWDIDFAFWAQEPTSDVFQGIGRGCGIDLGEPAYLRRYGQFLQDLANGPLVSTKVSPVLDAKYNAFVTNGRTVENPASIKNYIYTRRTNLLSVISNRFAAAFAVNGSSQTLTTDRNLVTISGTAPLDVRTIVVDGIPLPVTWTSVSNWTAQLVLGAGQSARVVQGLDANGSQFPGAITVLNTSYTGTLDPPEKALVINEIMYNPAVPDTGFIELYNRSTNTAFDLSGWRLDGVDFVFPGGSIIGADRFLVVVANRPAFALAYGAAIPVAGEFGGKLQNGGETLRLVKPGQSAQPDQVINAVRYDSEAPWPTAANGSGSSLQLIDPSQDNARAGNWAVASTNPEPQWRYVTATATVSSSALYLYLQNPGEAYIDDIKLVAGTIPENGPNLLANGDFESLFPGPWTVAPNFSGSAASTTVKHSGNSSLHMVATSGGTTRGSVILQDISPALVLPATYTLSFWYLENPKGGTLTLRFSGSALSVTTNIAMPVLQAGSTPGAANTVRASLPAFPTLWLNEVSPQNLTGPTDRFGHRHPWVELFNSGAKDVDLTGVFLANSYTNLTQWKFPAGATLRSNSFLVVWVDGNPSESASSEFHANFTIPADKGSLALATTNSSRTVLLDYLNYSVVQPDRSYGKLPDGSALNQQRIYYPTPGATNRSDPGPLSVQINEWMADNKTTILDPADHVSADWFELYNSGTDTAFLSGYYLGTSLTNRTKYRIPDGYTVPPGGYLLVWADDETSQNSTNDPNLHVNFKLSKDGESIGLFAPNGDVVDFVTFGPQAQDVSEGRFPDGASSYLRLTAPTPNAANYFEQPNSPPVLAPVPDQTLFEQQLLVLTVSASDTNWPTQQLSFSLDAGSPTNAFINPDTGLFSWRPSDGQAGQWPVTIRVTDDGVPSLSASTTFQVLVAPRPRLGSIVAGADGGWSLTFVSLPGRTYRVEYKNALTEPFWQALGADTIATGESLIVSDPASGSVQRFYRIVVIP